MGAALAAPLAVSLAPGLPHDAILGCYFFAGVIVFVAVTFWQAGHAIAGWLHRDRMPTRAKVTMEEMYGEREYANTRNAAQSFLKGGGHGRP